MFSRLIRGFRLLGLPLPGFVLTLAAVAAPVFIQDALAQDKPIRIGLLYDLSGPFAAAGSVASQIGAQIAIDLTNERGGVLGKYKVEAVERRFAKQARCRHQRGRKADQPGACRRHRRGVFERGRRAAREQGRGAEEDLVDHHGGRHFRLQGPQPELRVPGADPLRSIWAGRHRFFDRAREARPRRRAQGPQGRDHL